MDKPAPLLSRHGLWRSYGTAEGLDLLDLQLEHIAEDQDGCLWFGTAFNGALCFDSVSFRRFTSAQGLSGNNVMAILKDRRERLWFATWFSDGLCWYDGREFHRVEGTSGESISFLFEDREGRVWAAGRRIIGYWSEDGFHNLTPADNPQRELLDWVCWGIAQDRGGDLWFGYYGLHRPGQVLRYDGRLFHQVGEAEGLPASDAPCALGQDGEGNIWIGRGNQVWRFDGQQFQSLPPLDLGQGYVRKIQCDRQGRIWLCTSGGVFWGDVDRFQPFTPRDGLTHETVNAVWQDREGVFWFATYGGGICCYDPERIQVFGRNKGLPHEKVSALIEDQQRGLWLGFSTLTSEFPRTQSAGFFDGERFTSLGIEPTTGGCRALCQDTQGRLWLGFGAGLFCAEGQTVRQLGLAEGFSGWMVSAIAEDQQGHLLIGHWAGDPNRICLSGYDGHSCYPLFAREQVEMGGFYIPSIVQRRNGERWFALGSLSARDQGGGIGRLNPAGAVEWLTARDGLVDDRVEALLEDRQGRLWVATQGGISCFDGTSCRNFTTAEGLPSDHVLCIYEDEEGQLWFGTSAGLVRYNGTFFQTIRSPHLGPVRTVLQDWQGHFWLAAYNGLIRYTPGAAFPRVRLLQVVADRVYAAGEPVEFSTATRQVFFEYQGLSYHTQTLDMLYTCRLQGHEKEWQPPTHALRTHYQDLPPGEYTFQVRAIDRDLNYSAPATMQLRVVPDPGVEAWREALAGAAGNFVGRSLALRRVQQQLAQVAPTELVVLILGETGTGKGLAARTVHALSRQQSGPFLQVNCGGLPLGLVESELFGHEKGAFTGATSRKLGKVELAAGGTLFLDEIGDLSLEAQVKLLRLLEERTFERVGGAKTMQVEVRVITATNRDLEQMVKKGQFREDLYFRLLVYPVTLPPLRQRQEDIAELATYFAARMAAHLDKKIERLAPETLTALQAYAWPGNVRELEHAVQRAVVVCPGPVIRREDLALGTSGQPSTEEILPLAEIERRHIQEVLEKTGWVIKGPKGAAALLGMPASTLRDHMERLGIARG